MMHNKHMEKISLKFSLHSLQPGFLVIRASADADMSSFVIPEWQEMKKKGWSGGIIISDDIGIESIQDDELESYGLMRVPAGEAQNETNEQHS